jgi:hypothetical protein
MEKASSAGPSGADALAYQGQTEARATPDVKHNVYAPERESRYRPTPDLLEQGQVQIVDPSASAVLRKRGNPVWAVIRVAGLIQGVSPDGTGLADEYAANIDRGSSTPGCHRLHPTQLKTVAALKSGRSRPPHVSAQGNVKLVVIVAPDAKVPSTAVLSVKPVKLALSVYLPAAAVSAVNASTAGTAT